MDPIGPLMSEHRLIERMIVLMQNEFQNIQSTGKVHPNFIKAAVDFFKTYADKTHHGKEEDILFRELGRKPLSEEHQRVMGELLEEHVQARKMVTELSEANDKYVDSDESSKDTVLDLLKKLSDFYPKHIEKEDKSFFPETEKYFTEQELDTMVQEFIEFDKSMIHEKYKSVIEELESK